MSFFNPQELGKSIKIKDEGILLTGNVSSIDFVGAGVSGSYVGSEVTETITGEATSYTNVVGEAPTGTIDGVNKEFTIANTPIANTFKLYFNGLRQKETSDFTLSGTTITFVEAPMEGTNILVDYQY